MAITKTLRNRDTKYPSLDSKYSKSSRFDRRTSSQHPSAKPIEIRQGAYFPHWTRDGATYAVTMRLADSLPRRVLATWERERADLRRRANDREDPLASDELRRWEFLQSERVEQYLDTGRGQCWLRRPDVAQLVATALQFFHEDRYDMLAWCIMPNHVHAVFTPAAGGGLSDIVHSWKSFTGKEANKLIGRIGTFWQPEPYDHLVRDEDDLRHAISYTLANPAKAGLMDWPWVWAQPGLAAESMKLWVPVR